MNSSAQDSRDGGSTPPGPQEDLQVFAISRTDALQRFQRSLGGSTLYINTVAVALEVVSGDPSLAEEAAKKLNLGWQAPSDVKASSLEGLATRLHLPAGEQRMRQLTAQARTFVLRSVLTSAIDALDVYLGSVARLSWLNFSNEMVLVCTKAKTPLGGRAYSISDRCEALCNELELTEVLKLLPLVALASRWRNALVHFDDADFKLDSKDRSALKSNFATFNKAGFDVITTIDRFDQKKPPTLKDVTTLLAYMQDICGSIDSSAIRRVAGSADDVMKVLKDRLRSRFRTRNKLYEFWGVSRSNEWSSSERAKRGHERVDRGEFEVKWNSRFANLLSSIGFPKTGRATSAQIPLDQLERIRGACARELADELQLPLMESKK